MHTLLDALLWNFLRTITTKHNPAYTGRIAMRSDIVFDALRTKNRFALCHEAFKAVRLLHKDNTRIADTTNDALKRLAGIELSEDLITPEDVAKPSQETAPTPLEAEVS